MKLITSLVCCGIGTTALLAAPEVVKQNQLLRPEPFAQSPLQINPPSFRWLEVDGSMAYTLALSRTADFAASETVTTRHGFFRPARPLAPGIWYWRTRVEAPSPGPWSEAVSFTLAEELPRWTVPEWAELKARIPTDHPRLFLRAEDVPALRARAKALGEELTPWLAAAREALSAPFDLASHQAKVPAGAETAALGSRERRLLTWASKDAAYELAHPIGDAAWIALATEDPGFIAAAKERALYAARSDPHGLMSDEYSDFGNARLVAHLGMAYDLLHEHWNEAERAELRAAIRERARPIFTRMATVSQSLMRPHDWQYSFLDALQGALAIYGEEPEAEAWVEVGLRVFVAFYPWFGGNDGSSAEGVRYYHNTGMISSLRTLDFFRAAFGLALEEGNPWFRAAPYYLIYGFPPGGYMARLGDTVTGDASSTGDQPGPTGTARFAAQRMARLYDNGQIAAYAELLPEDQPDYTVAEFLRWAGPVEVAPVPLDTLSPARLFADNGIVFTHSRLTASEDNVRFVFHSSPYGAFRHGHADQNSFHVIAYNEELLLDSGYHTPSGDPHRQQWYVQTKAHNTLLVDGHGQPYGDNRGHGRITHYEQNEDWVYFVGDASAAYPDAPLTRFDRHVVWLRGDDVETYVIVDEVESAGGVPRRFDWLLHAANEMGIDAASGTIAVMGEKGQARVTLAEPDQLTINQRTGFDGLKAIYWRQGQNFPLPDQWHLTASRAPAERARFVAVIQVGKLGTALPSVEVNSGGARAAGWQVRFDATQHRLLIQPAP